MRRVADRLGSGVMSLYRHVKDKEQLIALAIDAVFAEEPFPDPAPAEWAARLRESARRQWRCYHRHPWIASVVSLARPRFGPNGMREMEWAFEGMQRLPIDDSGRLRFYLVVTAFVHGAAGQASAEGVEERRSGLPAGEWWKSQSGQLAGILSTGRYPLISRLGSATRAEPDEVFEWGLETLLEGLRSTLADTPRDVPSSRARGAS